jgi:transcriptional regulator with XRE-family HTH domain
MDIHEVLEALRKHSGVSKAKLARQSGLNRQSLTDFLNRGIGGSYETVRRAALALGVSSLLVYYMADPDEFHHCFKISRRKMRKQIKRILQEMDRRCTAHEAKKKKRRLARRSR